MLLSSFPQLLMAGFPCCPDPGWRGCARQQEARRL